MKINKMKLLRIFVIVLISSITIYFSINIAKNIIGQASEPELTLKEQIIVETENQLDEKSWNSIINVNSVIIKEYTATEKHEVFGPNWYKDIKGIDTYQATFRTTDDTFIGSIVLYFSKDDLSFLGGDARK